MKFPHAFCLSLPLLSPWRQRNFKVRQHFVETHSEQWLLITLSVTSGDGPTQPETGVTPLTSAEAPGNKKQRANALWPEHPVLVAGTHRCLWHSMCVYWWAGVLGSTCSSDVSCSALHSKAQGMEKYLCKRWNLPLLTAALKGKLPSQAGQSKGKPHTKWSLEPEHEVMI